MTMRRNRISLMVFPIASAVVAGLLLVACGSNGPEAVQSSGDVESAAPAVLVEEDPAPVAGGQGEVRRTHLVTVRLTWDGRDCAYEGPTALEPGPVELVFSNDDDETAWVAFNRHTGDQSVRDAVEHFGEAPSSTPCPSWKTDVARSSASPGVQYQWDGELEAATYHMVCYQRSPLRVWFGAGLVVDD